MAFFFKNCCRSCLVKDHKEVMFPLSNKRVREVFSGTALEVDANDKMPQQLCAKCYNRCIDWSNYISMACHSEKTMRDVIQGNGDANPEEDERVAGDIPLNVSRSTAKDEPVDDNSWSCFPCGVSFPIERELNEHKKTTQKCQSCEQDFICYGKNPHNCNPRLQLYYSLKKQLRGQQDSASQTMIRELNILRRQYMEERQSKKKQFRQQPYQRHCCDVCGRNNHQTQNCRYHPANQGPPMPMPFPGPDFFGHPNGGY